MKIIAPHLRLLSRLFISNVWLLETRSGPFLVDTGHFVERPLLQWSLWKSGIRHKNDLKGILLTHRHSDHAGNAHWLQQKFSCPVFCHEDDAEYLTGKIACRKMAVGKSPLPHEILCHVEDRLPARCDVVDTFRAGKWKWGFNVIHAPGHTEGSSMLFHEPTRSLFSGDVILSGPPVLRMIEKLGLARWEFSYDVEACHRHVRRYLKKLPRTEFLCSGHGPVVTERTAEKLKTLL